MTPSPYPKLAEAYRQLHAALADIEPAADRAVARDALRDALDRSASPDWHHGGMLADTYALEGTIHTGPAFVLHRLRHRDLGTTHVLKTLRDERRSEPALRAMLLSEGTHMLALSHPAILAARAVLRLPDGRPGLLLDHVEAQSLAKHLEAGPLSDKEVEQLALRLLDALCAIHAAGLLHLDLSPANILLPANRADKAVVCDFGLSLRVGGNHAEYDLESAASRSFASPQQLAGSIALDERDDLHALGRVIEACREARKGDSIDLWTARLALPDRTLRHADAYKAKRDLIAAIGPGTLRQ